MAVEDYEGDPGLKIYQFGACAVHLGNKLCSTMPACNGKIILKLSKYLQILHAEKTFLTVNSAER